MYFVVLIWSHNSYYIFKISSLIYISSVIKRVKFCTTYCGPSLLQIKLAYTSMTFLHRKSSISDSNIWTIQQQNFNLLEKESWSLSLTGALLKMKKLKSIWLVKNIYMSLPNKILLWCYITLSRKSVCSQTISRLYSDTFNRFF